MVTREKSHATILRSATRSATHDPPSPLHGEIHDTNPSGALLGAKVADMPAWSSCLIPDHDELAADPSAAPVLLIDGHYIIYRSFHGMPDLSAPDGTPVGALLGFCNVINKLVRFCNGAVEKSVHCAVHRMPCGRFSLSARATRTYYTLCCFCRCMRFSGSITTRGKLVRGSV